MKKARKLLSLALALALAFALVGVAGCGGDETDESADEPAAEETAGEFTTLTEGKIIVGSDTAFPPFENIENGEAVGFDVDLMKAIGEILDIEVEFKTYAFDAIITGLQAGTEFDMIASAMTITEERKESVDFSDPYINSNQSLAVAADSAIMSADDLKSGDKVAVQSGTTGEIWATENLAPKGVEIVPYGDILQAFGALQAGDVVGVVNDLPISQDIVKDPAREAKIAAEIQTGEQYGFAFNKANPELRDAVNDALDEVKADGTYAEIYEQWFGAAPTAIP